MEQSSISAGRRRIPLTICGTVVVGSGAAGFNAADRLYENGETDILLVTEGVNMGTSRNTGSDKQTYYKLTLCGDGGDSVEEMARTLHGGKCVDGDAALVEAALSSRCFYRLVELGVPFPQNPYGEFAGYKTDHDPRARATSVGPLTSKEMTERLEQAVRRKGIPIADSLLAVRVLTHQGRAVGLLCVRTGARDGEEPFEAFCCRNIVYATGGPAGMYADSVYPAGHHGASGAAFAAGVRGRNLTEWQFGLASTAPRWNVSGTYMQVLPRFISTLPDGSDPREFLADKFQSPAQLLNLVFLKGYEWPFDVRKAGDGSSQIDLLVYRERQLLGRRVFLDFRTNPLGRALDASSLSEEARTYLERAGAAFGTPLERLQAMNAPAVEFYRSRGVDLSAQPLEIALCAQHNNGGLETDLWWRTSLEGFYAVGEVSGSHGVYRPGGSALNAGQVGSTRAAEHIAAQGAGAPDVEQFLSAAVPQLEESAAFAGQLLSGGADNVNALWREFSAEMSRVAGPVRWAAQISAHRERVEAALEGFADTVRVSGPGRLAAAFRLYDMLLAQRVYLSAMEDHIAAGGRSRGSALYEDPSGDQTTRLLGEPLRYTLEDPEAQPEIQQAALEGERVVISRRPPKPIPQRDLFFENVWRAYRERTQG